MSGIGIVGTGIDTAPIRAAVLNVRTVNKRSTLPSRFAESFNIAAALNNNNSSNSSNPNSDRQSNINSSDQTHHVNSAASTVAISTRFARTASISASDTHHGDDVVTSHIRRNIISKRSTMTSLPTSTGPSSSPSLTASSQKSPNFSAHSPVASPRMRALPAPAAISTRHKRNQSDAASLSSSRSLLKNKIGKNNSPPSKSLTHSRTHSNGASPSPNTRASTASKSNEGDNITEMDLNSHMELQRNSSPKLNGKHRDSTASVVSVSGRRRRKPRTVNETDDDLTDADNEFDETAYVLSSSESDSPYSTWGSEDEEDELRVDDNQQQTSENENGGNGVSKERRRDKKHSTSSTSSRLGRRRKHANASRKSSRVQHPTSREQPLSPNEAHNQHDATILAQAGLEEESTPQESPEPPAMSITVETADIDGTAPIILTIDDSSAAGSIVTIGTNTESVANDTIVEPTSPRRRRHGRDPVENNKSEAADLTDVVKKSMSRRSTLPVGFATKAFASLTDKLLDSTANNLSLQQQTPAEEQEYDDNGDPIPQQPIVPELSKHASLLSEMKHNFSHYYEMKAKKLKEQQQANAAPPTSTNNTDALTTTTVASVTAADNGSVSAEATAAAVPVMETAAVIDATVATVSPSIDVNTSSSSTAGVTSSPGAINVNAAIAFNPSETQTTESAATLSTDAASSTIGSAGAPHVVIVCSPPPSPPTQAPRILSPRASQAPSLQRVGSQLSPEDSPFSSISSSKPKSSRRATDTSVNTFSQLSKQLNSKFSPHSPPLPSNTIKEVEKKGGHTRTMSHSKKLNIVPGTEASVTSHTKSSIARQTVKASVRLRNAAAAKTNSLAVPAGTGRRRNSLRENPFNAVRRPSRQISL